MKDGHATAERDVPAGHDTNLFGAGLYLDPEAGSLEPVTPQTQALLIAHTARTHVTRWMADNVTRLRRNGL